MAKIDPSARKYNYIVPPEIINGVQFPGLIRGSEIIPREMEWLWFPYIPQGAASLLFGPGGFGKSHIAVDIAARLTRGEPFPGQEGAGKAHAPMNVLILSAEDEPDVVMGPRLIRAGADMARIGFPQDPFVLTTAGVKRLESYLKNFDAGVVFIDPVVHYIGGKVDMNKANEVRAAIGVFHQMAMKHDIAIILVGHSRKGQDGEDYEKSMGSADFNNAVRSVMFVTRAPDGTRVMKHVKANYSALGPSLAYNFGHDGNGSFEWLGVYDGDDTMLGVNVPRRRVKRQGMIDLLKKWLKDGPMRSKEIEAMAAEEGYAMDAVHRAKNDLRVETIFVRLPGATSNKGSAWWMHLPGDERTPWLDGAGEGAGDVVDAPDGPATTIPPVDGGQPGDRGADAPLERPADRGPVDEGSGEGPAGDDPSVEAGGLGPREPADPAADPARIAAEWLRQRGLTDGAAQ